MITLADMEKALQFLSETDLEFSHRKRDMEHFLEKKKSMFAILKNAVDGSVAKKEAYAYDHQDYKNTCDQAFKAIADFEHLKNKRKTAEITIETWRSVNASIRRANVT